MSDMNFTVLFAIVSNLKFTLNFGVDQNTVQDYLFFHGRNSSAHLSRVNSTLTLYLYKENCYEVYKLDNVSHRFEFSWDKEYRVNSRLMSLEKFGCEVRTLFFDSFVFLSPILGIQNKNEPILEPIFSCQEINYGYIAFILFAGILGIEIKQFVPIIFKSIRRLRNSRESIYVDMKPPN